MHNRFSSRLRAGAAFAALSLLFLLVSLPALPTQAQAAGPFTTDFGSAALNSLCENAIEAVTLEGDSFAPMTVNASSPAATLVQAYDTNNNPVKVCQLLNNQTYTIDFNGAGATNISIQVGFYRATPGQSAQSFASLRVRYRGTGEQPNDILQQESFGGSGGPTTRTITRTSESTPTERAEINLSASSTEGLIAGFSLISGNFGPLAPPNVAPQLINLPVNVPFDEMSLDGTRFAQGAIISDSDFNGSGPSVSGDQRAGIVAVLGDTLPDLSPLFGSPGDSVNAPQNMGGMDDLPGMFAVVDTDQVDLVGTSIYPEGADTVNDIPIATAQSLDAALMQVGGPTGIVITFDSGPAIAALNNGYLVTDTDATNILRAISYQLDMRGMMNGITSLSEPMQMSQADQVPVTIAFFDGDGSVVTGSTVIDLPEVTSGGIDIREVDGWGSAGNACGIALDAAGLIDGFASSGATASTTLGDGSVCELSGQGSTQEIVFPGGAEEFRTALTIADSTGTNIITVTANGGNITQTYTFPNDGTQLAVVSAPEGGTLTDVTITWTQEASTAFFDDVAATISSTPAPNEVICAFAGPVDGAGNPVTPSEQNTATTTTTFDVRVICRQDETPGNEANVFGFEFDTADVADDLTLETDELATPGTSYTLASGTGDFFEASNATLGGSGTLNTLDLFSGSIGTGDVNDAIIESFGLGSLGFTVTTPIEDGRAENDEPEFTIGFETGTLSVSDPFGSPITATEQSALTITVQDVLDAELDVVNVLNSDGDLASGGFAGITVELFNDPTEALVNSSIANESAANISEGGTIAITAAPDFVNLTDDDSPLAVVIDALGHVDCIATNSAAGYALFDRPLVNELSGAVELIAGDTDDDNIINSTDSGNIVTDFGGSNTLPAGQTTDINGDGSINVLDLVHVGRNFGADYAATTVTNLPACSSSPLNFVQN